MPSDLGDEPQEHHPLDPSRFEPLGETRAFRHLHLETKSDLEAVLPALVGPGVLGFVRGESVDRGGLGPWYYCDGASWISVGGGSGMGPFNFDMIVDHNWATEVAAGRGIEGQTMPTSHGRTYEIYSSVQGGVDAADADDAPRSMLVCPGTYDEGVIIPASFGGGHHLAMYGSGKERTLIRSTALNYVGLTVNDSSASFYFKDITFVGDASTGGIGMESTASPGFVQCEDCDFEGDKGLEGSFRFSHFRRCDFNGPLSLAAGESWERVRFLDCVLLRTKPWAGDMTQVVYAACEHSDEKTFSGSPDINGLAFIGDTFRHASAGNTNGVDFSGAASAASIRAVEFLGNHFMLGTAGDKGIIGKAGSGPIHSIVKGNRFSGFAAGDEIIDMDNLGCIVDNNVTDSGRSLPSFAAAPAVGYIPFGSEPITGETYSP